MNFEDTIYEETWIYWAVWAAYMVRGQHLAALLLARNCAAVVVDYNLWLARQGVA